MLRRFGPLIAAIGLAGCAGEYATHNGTGAVSIANDTAPTQKTSIVRLDCGTIKVGNFSKTFSDKQVYAPGPKTLTNSCYLITHKGKHMLWDTGLPAALKGQTKTDGDFTTSLDKTIPDQLAQLGLKPEDIDIVGVSHMHFDHTGQAAQFPKTLVIGRADFDQSAGKDDPLGPWRKAEAESIIFVVGGELDIFGDGKVLALHLPGHTPDHLALLVNLYSGPVLLSGDLYHAAEAREKRGVPPFNTDRPQTLASMEKFEALAKRTGAKVIIQHEPADVAKLPAFPKAAQ
jgi:glyoxylase-like metal-dependent hydrolase (beta-lactamase superfamily II)